MQLLTILYVFKNWYYVIETFDVTFVYIHLVFKLQISLFIVTYPEALIIFINKITYTIVTV